MFARNAPNADGEHDPGDERYRGQLDEQVARRDDGRAALGLDVEGHLENPNGLLSVERLLAADHRVNEAFSPGDGLVGLDENLKLGRGVDHSGDDEGQHEGRRDEQQFSIEAHSYN